MTETHTPLPCPLCGNRAFVVHGNAPSVNGYAIWCVKDSCLRLPPRASEAEALTAWNTRADSHHRLVDALEAALKALAWIGDNCDDGAARLHADVAHDEIQESLAALKEAGRG